MCVCVLFFAIKVVQNKSRGSSRVNIILSPSPYISKILYSLCVHTHQSSMYILHRVCMHILLLCCTAAGLLYTVLLCVVCVVCVVCCIMLCVLCVLCFVFCVLCVVCVVCCVCSAGVCCVVREKSYRTK